MTWPSMSIGKNEPEQISSAFQIRVYLLFTNHDNSQNSFKMILNMAMLLYLVLED